jgi:hypothetical protein
MSRVLSTSAVVALAIICCSMPIAQAQEFVCIDLSAPANRKLTDNLGSGIEGNSLASLPTGEQIFNRVKFSVGPGLLVLGGMVQEDDPDKIEGIPVNRAFAKLHVLHATCFGGGPNAPGTDWHVKDGTLIGQYVLHYDDGSAEGLSITYGEDVRDWYYVDGEAEPSRGKVVWKGQNNRATQVGARLRLYASTYTNPKPKQKVVKIDYTSRKSETPAGPFCLAMTIEP